MVFDKSFKVIMMDEEGSFDMTARLWLLEVDHRVVLRAEPAKYMPTARPHMLMRNMQLVDTWSLVEWPGVYEVVLVKSEACDASSRHGDAVLARPVTLKVVKIAILTAILTTASRSLRSRPPASNAAQGSMF